MNNNRFDLTFPENNIYLVEKFNDGTAINTIAGLLEIKSIFNEEICNKIINKLIESNDALRIRVYEENNSTYQSVDEYIYENIEYIDMSDRTSKEIEKYLHDNVNIPFEINNYKLYEFKIIKYSKNTGCIFMKLHHIISDAWTLMQTINQLVRSYDDCLNNVNQDYVIPSYVDFIQSEKEYISSEKYIKDEQFWREYLNNIKSPVSLKDAVSKVSTNANRYSVTLSKKINDRINKYCKINKVSPYALFLGALSTYIYRIKNENDFVIGTPILNRSNFKEKQMLGMFISTMPIRMKIEENIKFLDLIKQIGSDTMSLFRHQKYPITKTLEHIHNTTDIKGEIYSIMLSYQNARSDIEEKSDIFSTEWLFSGYIQDDLEIHIMDMDNNGVLHINYDYLKDLFEKVEIKYLHTRLMAIIEDAMSDINVNVENIRIMSKEEENKILYEFNDTDTNYPKNKTVIQLFEEQVEKTPDNIALVFEDKKMTYRELNDKANQLAWYLREEKKLKPSDIVSLLFKRSVEMIISILGVLKSGAAYLPIDSEFPYDRIKYILEDSNSKLLITNMNYINNNIDIVYIDDFDYRNYKNINLLNINNGKDLIYVIYTSGTTGKPKGVMISHDNLLNLVFAADAVKKLSSCEVALSMCKYCFDMFVIETIVPLLLGIKIIFLNEEESISPYKILDIVKTAYVQIMFITPTKLNLILQKKENIEKLKSIKKLTIAGEVFNINVLKILQKSNMDIFNGYGPTETTVCSSIKKIKNYDDINIGKPIPNTKSFIIDTKNRILPIEVKGQLIVAGSGVGLGYLNVDNNLSSKFITLFGFKAYKTGDEALYNFNGDLKYNKRIDNQIKINGLRIEIEEIESNINNFNGIISNVVIVKKINDVEKLVCYITINENFDKNINIIDKLSLLLPKYMVPNKLYIINEMPLNTNGKVDREQLKKMIDNDKNNYGCLVEKYDLKDKKLEKILIKYNINSHEFLFKQNIDSIEAIKLSIEISDEYNIDFTIKDVYNSENLEMLENSIQIKSLNSKENIRFNSLENKNEYLLTPSQLGIFSNYILDTQSIVYNTGFEIKLEKNIDTKKLIKSIEVSILNHSSLFSKIYIKESKPYFKVREKSIKIDLTETNEIEYSEIKKNFIKPFDLLKDLLFKVKVYKTEKQIYILMDFNHIIIDGHSINILLEDIINVYNDNPIKKEELTFGQCTQIVKDENKYLKSKKFFLDKLNGELPVVSLNTDYTRGINKSFKGNKIKKVINFKLKEKLVKFSKENNITLNNLFLGVFNFVISKYTYNEDIIIGIATSGREFRQELNTTGMFVKTLPYRIEIDLDNSFLEYIKQTQVLMLEVIENSSYSLEEMVKDLKVKRDISRNPLFDIVYVYQNAGMPQMYLEGEKLEINEIKTNTSKFDMAFEILPKEEQIDLNVEYDTSLFKQETIENFALHVINALEYITENKEANLRDIEIISKEEKKIILKDFNNTKANYPSDKTIHQLFEEQVKLNPNKIAIIYDGESFTYRELNEKANQLAHHLLEQGVKKEEYVMVLTEKSFETIVGILGILKAGCTYVPIEKGINIERLKYIIKFLNLNYIIISEKDIFEVDVKIKCIRLFKDIVNNVQSNLEIINNSNDTAYVTFTSGTTGNPKGVKNSHRSIIRLVRNINYVDISKVETVFLAGDLAFDASVFEMWVSLLNGLQLIIIKKQVLLNPNEYEKLQSKYSKILTLIVTPLFNQYVENNLNAFSNMEYILVGGDVFKSYYANKVLERYPDLHLLNMYGPTECAVAATTQDLKEVYKNSEIPIGRPISNSKCLILDKCNKLSPINLPGELFIGGDAVGNGYINNEELNKKCFVNTEYDNQKLYKTGDISKWDDIGRIYFIERIDCQFKIRGFRVELNEISNKALLNKNISEVFVNIVIENNDKNIVLYYVLKPNCELNEIELRRYFKNFLPNYMIPKYIIKIDKIPLNKNGKVNVQELSKVKINEKSNFKLSKIQKFIEIELEKFLNIKNIDININMFDIGMDSINVIQFISRLKEFNIDISYADIFNNPTIYELCEYINGSMKKDLYIEKYNYGEVNKALNIKYNKIKKTENILITGATGFLGIHVLADFLDNKDGLAYLVIRSKKLSAVDRLIEQLNYYFNGKYIDLINKRIMILEYDLLDNNLNEILEKNSIYTKIDTIINCSAHVKHFGKKEIFQKMNVELVKQLINFCTKFEIKLVHISTLSISRSGLEDKNAKKNLNKIKIFTEKDLYIGQKIENIYSLSKFLAEVEILEAISNGLNATIVRLGNLTNRISDGIFQKNSEENAFMTRLKFVMREKIIPKTFYNKGSIEMSPIDLVSNAIIKILDNMKLPVYNLYNNNFLPINEFVIYLKKYQNINISIVEDEQFVNTIINSKDSSSSVLVMDLSSNGKLDYSSDVILDSTITNQELEKLGFSWNKINSEYLDKVLKNSKDEVREYEYK